MWWQRVLGTRKPRKPRLCRCPSLKVELLESRQLLSSGSLEQTAAAFSLPGSTSARGLASVTYHGGPLLQNVQIQAVFDGQAWNTDANLQQVVQQTDGFLQYFVTSPYMDVLKQYNVSTGTFLGNDVVGQSSAQTISDSQIQSILNAEISSGKLSAPTANSLYIFFTTPGTVVTDGNQNSASDFAGYHSAFTDQAGAPVYYAVIPYPTGNIANVPLTTFQQETVVLSHEISEAVTDPDTQSGWFSARLGEIGDIAEGQVGQLGGYEVQAVWSQSANQVVLPSASTSSTVQVTGVPVHATADQAFTSIVATITGADSSATAGSFTATIQWGDGNTTTGAITSDPNGGFDVSGTNTYAHAGSYTITVTVKDSSGAALGTAETRATVDVAASSIEAKGLVLDATAGTPFTGNVATFTSTSSTATPSSFTATINWGDGTTSAGTIVVDPNGGFDVQGTHTYASSSQSDEGSPWNGLDSYHGPFGNHGYVITVMIDDTQVGSSATAVSLARVAAAPSAITATGQNITVVAGQSFTGTVATFTDTNTSAAAGDFTATIHWGDGTTSVGTVGAGPNGGFVVSGTHTYTQTSDGWGWGDPWGERSGSGNSYRIVSVDIIDTKTQDKASTKSLATITPTASSLTVTAQNITATAGTQFSGVVANFTDTSAGTSVSTLTATIDWGDGTSSQGTVTANPSGGFTVTGTHTYAADSDADAAGDRSGNGYGARRLFSVTVQDTTANTSATALGIATITSGSSSSSSTASTASTALNQLFVTQLYQSLLGRLPEVNGLTYWTNLLNQGTSRSSVAAQIEQSQEYRTDEVQTLYQKMLNRQADPTGLTAFTTLLGNGGTLEQAQALIAGSQEYFQVRGGGQASTYLQALYADALNRGIDATGQAVFSQALAQGTSRQAVAAAIFGSGEYRQNLVQNDYQTYLGRAADSGGLTTFMSGLQQGMSDQAMVAAMVGSQEYFDKM
jgi:hypothetical protein